MSLTAIVVEGTIKPDGTLELKQKLSLPPGRVTVVLQQESQPGTTPQEGWWPYMQRVRVEREAAGYHFMSEAEMEAHLRWLREEDQIDEMLREADQRRQQPEQP